MDTQNDGLEKVDSLKIWPFLVSMLDFWGANLFWKKDKKVWSYTHTHNIFSTQIRLRPCFTSASMNVDFFEACGKNQKKRARNQKKTCKKRPQRGTNKRCFKTEREMGKEKPRRRGRKKTKRNAIRRRIKTDNWSSTCMIPPLIHLANTFQLQPHLRQPLAEEQHLHQFRAIFPSIERRNSGACCVQTIPACWKSLTVSRCLLANIFLRIFLDKCLGLLNVSFLWTCKLSSKLDSYNPIMPMLCSRDTQTLTECTPLWTTD